MSANKDVVYCWRAETAAARAVGSPRSTLSNAEARTALAAAAAADCERRSVAASRFRDAAFATIAALKVGHHSRRAESSSKGAVLHCAAAHSSKASRRGGCLLKNIRVRRCPGPTSEGAAARRWRTTVR